jgi:prepilin-type N-terminal cleavage/methylation domain-containing protein
MIRKQAGFSLIELMVVLAIIGILAAIAIPSYLGIQKKGRRTEFKANLEILRLLEEKHYAEHGQYVDGADTTELMIELPEFRPGDPADLSYAYSVRLDDPDGQTFTAIATGKAGLSDAGVAFSVNEDNDRNGW